MAKYDVTYSCGHEGTVDLFGKTSERERKLAWYESTAVCPECYKKQQREKGEKEGLILNVAIDPYSQEKPIKLSFTGNTYPAKDDIKALGGYYYGECATGVFGILSAKPAKCWQKDCSLDDLEQELQKASELNPTVNNGINEADIAAYHEVAARRASNK